jgi:hypothetical protein
MAVIKCGACRKYYNNGQHSACPSCGASLAQVAPEEFEDTQPLNDLGSFATESVSEPTSLGMYAQQSEVSDDNPFNTDDLDTTVALDQEDDGDDEVTVALSSKAIGIDPVCGWLVCVEGPDKGRDYRIKSERNFIGRSANQDIVISGDQTISRENHASITQDPKTLIFTINTGSGRGLVYLNQSVVETPQQLSIYDVVEIGDTKLIFIPFTTDSFKWE